MQQAITNLKAQIKSNQCESLRIRECIRTSSGKSRWWNWQSKRELGAGTRVLLLAYGALRGRPYATIERSCRTEISPTAILQTIQKALGQAPERETWTLECVKAWLEGPGDSQAKEAA